MTARERGWEFPYAPVPTSAGDDDGGPIDVIVAMGEPVDTRALADAIARVAESLEIEPILARAPLFWWRVRSTVAATRAAIARVLREDDLPLRYVASASRSSLQLGPRLRFEGVRRARAEASAVARAWAARAAPSMIDDAPTEGRWFLRDHDGGIAVDRALGTGAGMRLAVIDDDGAEAEELDLEAEVLVTVERASRATSHGALMVAWACGTGGARPFHGVAPGASPRLYVIPKAGIDVVSLPLAVARATFDGADVIVCATYLEGSTSPMLDDALDVARHLGRRGRGTPVVLPTGREASSPAQSVHSSWSLALGDPASDPRVLCIGPSARGESERGEGAWFMWRDRRGRLRPFANRGPELRWLAPGDDIAYPFGNRDRLFHAESSGASAIAAGTLLLVLGANPSLRVRELDAIVTRTCAPVPPEHDPSRTPLADPADVRPHGLDADRHNAKHGYGRLHARRAVLAAVDPLSFALTALGEEAAARTWAGRARPWSPRLARWAVRVLIRDESLAHEAKALARHARLVAGRPDRALAHGEGALVRHLALFVRALRDARPPASLRAELDAIGTTLEEHPTDVEQAAQTAFDRLWPPAKTTRLHVDGEPPLGTGGVRL